MTKRVPIGLLLFATAACAARPPGAEPTPSGDAAALAYTLGEATSAAYEAADTTRVSMQGAGFNVQVDAVARIGAELSLSPASNGIRGTIRFTTIEGRATNSMGPTHTVTRNDIPGPAEVTVSQRGVVDVVQAPQLTENLQRVVNVSDLYRRYFMRLPAQPVSRGEAWTDTVSITEQTLGLTSAMVSVITSVYARDTTVAGRTLNVITSTMQNTVKVSGETEGVQLEQDLSGEGSATTVWDPSRRLIVERRETGSASGTTGLPAMGISGMPTTVRATQTLRLAAGR